ncbi:adaptor protein MecA [Caldifermentibacillus hisashii]|uniref:adaptor protein MecA n=1 Tax=Caldifermentibacillus hisashii TaxID=996558 RepID=UPI0034D6DAE1
MRLERIDGNQIKIFLTYDELVELGLSEDDVDKNSLKWHQLFFNMINEAYEEFEQFMEGTIIIEVYSLQTQGLVISFTLKEDDDFSFENDLFQSQDWNDSTQVNAEFLYLFTDIENLLQFAHRIYPVWQGGSLFTYKNHYYLYLLINDETKIDQISSILSEYGDNSPITYAFLEEYGRCLINESAIQILMKHFQIL